MALYRVSVLFEGRGHGWAETLVFDRTNTSPGAVAASLVGLLNARAQLLGREYRIIGARVAKIRDDAGLPVKRNVFLIQQEFKPSNQLVANAGGPPDDCVLVRGTTADGNRSKPIFLGGIPDDIILNGGALDLAAVNWGANFATWNNEMVTRQAGWLGLVAKGERFITSYTVNPTGINLFTVNAAVFDGTNAGVNQTVRIRQLNGGNSVFNRSLLVYPVSTTQFQNVRPMAAVDFISQGIVTVFTLPSTFFIAAAWGAVKYASHKRGRPLLVSPGRARRRATV